MLAADEALLPANQTLSTLALPNADLAALAVTVAAAPAGRQTWPGAMIFKVNATTPHGGGLFTANLIPFADAGATGARYQVWLPLAGQPKGN